MINARWHEELVVNNYLHGVSTFGRDSCDITDVLARRIDMTSLRFAEREVTRRGLSVELAPA